ncbi:hypothetical protein KC992_04585, partial [Candidatus Saccharibacteria bacterium]|nr:hypothetical protein [Candidatus Saccharibacteria bacterium]
SGVTVFVSNDDNESIIKTVEIVESTLPDVVVTRFEGMKHFCLEDMGTEEFPELLEEVLSS